MKRKIILFTLAAIALTTVVASCVKSLEDEGISNTTEYVGTVVEKSTMKPIPNVIVQVTDGTHIHATGTTDDKGAFSIKHINFDEVNENYYLWLDGSRLDLPTKQEELKGLGRKLYDYKTLILYDKTNTNILPKVTTDQISDIMAFTAKIQGTVTSDGGHSVSARGVCYAIHQTPTLDDIVVTAGTGTGNYTCTLTGLTKGTTYYVRAFATNSIGTIYGAQKTFTTQSGNATISTTAATEVKATTAIVGGNITADGGSTITARGVCWGTTQNPTLTNNRTTDGSGIGSFSHTLQGLSRGTTYYYRAYATNAVGTTYAAQKSFTTTSGLPVVTTTAISDITATTAKSGGNITDNGGYDVTARGICWNTMGAPDINDQHTTNGNGNGSFTSNMSNLSPSTTYYVRAYAVNSVGTSYSNQISFTTQNGLPTVTTGDVVNITANSAVCNGSNVTSDGGFTVTNKGLCWSTSQYPTTSNSKTTNGSGTGTFNGSLTNLQANTTYYVRAYATNSRGTVYGSQRSFTTTRGLPTVTTTAPTLNGTIVASGGNVTSDGGVAVTARGICYGIYPYPDISSSYQHTTNGSGTGYYSSSFSLPTGSGRYYIRAYATNANGTSYGTQVTVIQPYDTLPTFTRNGHTYRVAPVSTNQYYWNFANDYCNDLTLFGYSDWRLPTKEELMQMYVDGLLLGNRYYWSSSIGSSSSYHYHIYNGQLQTSYNTNQFCYAIPIRQEN